MSKFVAWQVVSLMKNEQQSQNLLLEVHPRSTFRNIVFQPKTNVFVARQVDHTRWKTRNIDPKTCNETMLRDKLRVFVSRSLPPLIYLGKKFKMCFSIQHSILGFCDWLLRFKRRVRNDVYFLLLFSQHHCRICGRIFCFNCSNNWLQTPHSRYLSCHLILAVQRPSDCSATASNNAIRQKSVRIDAEKLGSNKRILTGYHSQQAVDYRSHNIVAILIV